MSNAVIARGLQPYRHADGSVWNGSCNVYAVKSTYASNIFVGDPVVQVSADNDTNGIPGVRLATAGTANLVLGCMVGIVAAGNPVIAVTRDMSVYHPASTAQYILVADDPQLIFWIQEDASGSSFSGFPGKNANLVSGTGSTTTGYSGWQMLGSTIATGNATFQLKVLKPLEQPDNDSTLASAKWLVKINQHALANGTVGA